MDFLPQLHFLRSFLYHDAPPTFPPLLSLVAAVVARALGELHCPGRTNSERGVGDTAFGAICAD